MDRDMLVAHAERVGLKVSDIRSTEPVQRELIDILDWRAAFLSEPKRYDHDKAEEVIQADLHRLAGSAAVGA
jgi:hypothetical protein